MFLIKTWMETAREHCGIRKKQEISTPPRVWQAETVSKIAKKLLMLWRLMLRDKQHLKQSCVKIIGTSSDANSLFCRSRRSGHNLRLYSPLLTFMTTKTDPMRDVRCDRALLQHNKANKFIYFPLSVDNFTSLSQSVAFVVKSHSQSTQKRNDLKNKFRWNWNISERSLLHVLCLAAASSV